MWMFQTPVFSELYHVITPDSRGLGLSSRSSEGYSLGQLSDDLLILLDYLGIERCFLIGSSMGANVSQKFAIDHPERVQATVWVAGARLPMDQMTFAGNEDIGTRERDRPFTEIYLEALRKGGYLHFWETIWKPTMHFQFHEGFSKSYIGSYFIKYLFEERYSRLNEDASGVIGLLEGFRREVSLDQDLSRVKVPASIVVGDGDDSRSYCEEQHKSMPNLGYHVIKNSGHFCYIDQPELFNNFLISFLKANQFS